MAVTLMLTRTVAQQLRDLARRVSAVQARGSPGVITETADYTAIVDEDASTLLSRFPAALNAARTHITLPPFIVDFFRPLAVGSVTLGLMAGPCWARLTLRASATDDGARSPLDPVDVTLIGDPVIEIVADPGGALPANEPGIGYGDPCDYYFWLARVVNGRITSTINTTYIETSMPRADPSD